MGGSAEAAAATSHQGRVVPLFIVLGLGSLSLMLLISRARRRDGAPVDLFLFHGFMDSSLGKSPPYALTRMAGAGLGSVLLDSKY